MKQQQQGINIMPVVIIQQSMHRLMALPVVLLLQAMLLMVMALLMLVHKVIHRAVMNHHQFHMVQRVVPSKVSNHLLLISILEAILLVVVVAIKPIHPSKPFHNRLNSKSSVFND